MQSETHDFEAEEFVAASVAGDQAACRERLGAMHLQLAAHYESGRIAGYTCEVLADEDEIVDAELSPEPIVAAADGRFPCLFVNVTWSGPRPEFLDDFARAHDLKRT